MDDLISRRDAIDAVMKFMPSLTTPDGCGQFDREIFEAQEMFVDIGQALNKLPSAQPDNRLAKIADLVEGTIDHFDLDDAMDLLYQIKDVLDGSDELPSAQPEKSTTAEKSQLAEEKSTRKLIYLDDAIDAVMSGMCTFYDCDVIERLEDLQSAQPYTEEEIQVMQDLEQAQLDKAYETGLREERKKGEWIEQDDGWDAIYYECSVCKEPFMLFDGTPQDNLYNFCPCCGADMRGENIC